MRLLILCLLISSCTFAQQNKQQLAFSYYTNGEYAKAITIYQELEKENFSVSYYIHYFSSLLENSNYKAAEKLARKLSKIYPRSLSYQLEIGIAQEKSGNQRKADYTYKKVLMQLTGQQSQAINLANTFIRYNLYRAALNVYHQVEEINLEASFCIQKAQLYEYLNNTDLMINEYLNALKNNPSRKQFVMSKVQRFLNNDGIKSEKNYQLVKKQLLPFVRQERSRADFSEILIWLFMQNTQYKMALLQAKALDRRLDFDGEGVYDLGDSFLNSKNYNLAVEAYDYVIEKGDKNRFFISANINKLFSLTKSMGEQEIDLNALDLRYNQVIFDLGKNKNTVLLLSNYAHFKAFYMHDLFSASKILDEAMQIPQISKLDLAQCKLEYADIMLLQGNIWESLLYYSQVEKDFKENPIGHEAKLRRAKIAYYQCDFDWAQAQLGTLKASTSKLIANDAMQLSLLIIDNLNLDTSNIAMCTFASAELLIYQQKYEKSIEKYDSILIAFPGHSLSDEIYMRKAETYIKLNNINMAVKMYEKISSNWNYDILADDAIFQLAKLYENNLADKDKAMQLYEKILLEYNSSIFTVEARKRFRKLRGDN